MKNIMEFEGGYQAVISYDPEIEMFRGEFLELNGGADFYARDTDSLRREGETSLGVFLRMCAEDGVPPKKIQGKFALRLDPDLYRKVSAAASASGMSMNRFIAERLRRSLQADA